MDDFTKMMLILSTVLTSDLLMLGYFVIRKNSRTSTGQNYTPEWKEMQAKAGCFLSVCGLTVVICWAVYVRTLIIWMVDVCPRMSTLEDCTVAPKTWGNVGWWLILPLLIAGSLIFTSCPRARDTLVHNPERLYFLTDHVVSMIMFQISLIFSLPLAYPFVFFRTLEDRQKWMVVSLICGVLMVGAYIMGIAFWVQGLVKVWIQPRGRAPRPSIQEGEFILLRSVPNTQQD